ncbi:MAG: molybdopterin-synthase adenylyltransferase MoeB [Geminicoccaceae bacterium]|nr:MAG: molybdopterin-synthase adenylyltransferase MoeB [Geminicoccaceae bacterium]
MTEPFDDDELERYARQIVLPEVGGRGQDRLRAARALVVGVGGLGCPAALYLAAAGVGQLTLIDDDRVDLGNLHRQVLFRTGDIGRPKVEVAAAALRERDPRVRITPLAARLDETNARTIIAGHDLVLDGSDNFATRALVAAAAAAAKVPLISGSVQGFAGQLTLLAPFADPTSPCFRCLFPADPAANALPSCAVAGVVGPIAGWVGTMMASEAVKWVLGVGQPTVGRMLLIDGLEARVEEIRVGRRRTCGTACRHRVGRAAAA